MCRNPVRLIWSCAEKCHLVKGWRRTVSVELRRWKWRPLTAVWKIDSDCSQMSEPFLPLYRGAERVERFGWVEFTQAFRVEWITGALWVYWRWQVENVANGTVWHLEWEWYDLFKMFYFITLHGCYENPLFLTLTLAKLFFNLYPDPFEWDVFR